MQKTGLWAGVRALVASPASMKRWRRERRKRMFGRPHEDLFDWGLDRDFQRAMEQSMAGWSSENLSD